MYEDFGLQSTLTQILSYSNPLLKDIHYNVPWTPLARSIVYLHKIWGMLTESHALDIWRFPHFTIYIDFLHAILGGAKPNGPTEYKIALLYFTFSLRRRAPHLPELISEWMLQFMFGEDTINALQVVRGSCFEKSKSSKCSRK